MKTQNALLILSLSLVAAAPAFGFSGRSEPSAPRAPLPTAVPRDCRNPREVAMHDQTKVVFCDPAPGSAPVSASRNPTSERIVGQMAFQFVGLMKALAGDPLFGTVDRVRENAELARVVQAQATLWAGAIPQNFLSLSAMSVLRIMSDNVVGYREDPEGYVNGVSRLNNFTGKALAYALLSAAGIEHATNPLPLALIRRLAAGMGLPSPNGARAYSALFCRADADPCPAEQQIMMRDLYSAGR